MGVGLVLSLCKRIVELTAARSNTPVFHLFLFGRIFIRTFPCFPSSGATLLPQLGLTLCGKEYDIIKTIWETMHRIISLFVFFLRWRANSWPTYFSLLFPLYFHSHSLLVSLWAHSQSVPGLHLICGYVCPPAGTRNILVKTCLIET